MVRGLWLRHWRDDCLRCVLDAIVRRVMYGRSCRVRQRHGIVMCGVCGNARAVEVVDGFTEGEFLVMRISEVCARGRIVGIGLLTMVAIVVVMLDVRVMSGSEPVGIFVCRGMVKVALVMMIPWNSGVLVRVSRSAG